MGPVVFRMRSPDSHPAGLRKHLHPRPANSRRRGALIAVPNECWRVPRLFAIPSPAMTPDTCPNCGADVPRNAKACPECGSDENTGWSEEAYAGKLNLPDDKFDYDEFV